MPRAVKVQTREMGFIDLYLIYAHKGVWEEQWRPLQVAEAFVAQFPTLPKEHMEQAYIGWTKPLVSALGPPPRGILLTIPPVTRQCALRSPCVFYRASDCYSTAKKKPLCFEPDGFESEEVRRLASECIRLWHEGVYILVVQEP
jgi:hypothetical protein